MPEPAHPSIHRAPHGPRVPRPLAVGGALLLVALVLGSLEAAQAYLRAVMQGRTVPWGSAWVDALPAWVILALLAPVPIALARTFRLDRGTRAGPVMVHLAGAAAFALLHQSGAALVLAWRFQDTRITLFISKMFSLFTSAAGVIGMKGGYLRSGRSIRVSSMRSAKRSGSAK